MEKPDALPPSDSEIMSTPEETHQSIASATVSSFPCPLPESALET